MGEIKHTYSLGTTSRPSYIVELWKLVIEWINGSMDQWINEVKDVWGCMLRRKLVVGEL